MKKRSRRNFLFNFSLAGLSFLPFLKAAAKLPFFIESSVTPLRPLPAAYNGVEPYIIDIHCHPNLKNYLRGARMYRHLTHWNTKGTNRYNMQVDLKNLRKGNVRGIIAAHHLPERGMVEQANTNRQLYYILRRVIPDLAGKVEPGDEANYRQTLYMMDEFESHVEKCNKKKPSIPIKIAKSFAEFENILTTGNAIAVIQSVEGMHSLGRRLGLSEYIERLNFLAARGICSITPAHFFPNDMAFPVEGIEPFDKKKIRLNWQYTPSYDNRGLTNIGKALVKQCFKVGIIVDLTHMTPLGRQDVFAVHKAFVREFGIMRPLIASHGGFQPVYERYKPANIPADKKDFSNYKFKSPSKCEVEYIIKTGGVVGVMGENFWLTGNDNHTSYTDTALFEDGIDYIVETIRALSEVTNPVSFDHISLGSDFDGFANAPADFRNPRYYPKLIQAIKSQIPGCDINAITHGNALRVLQTGWGNPVP